MGKKRRQKGEYTRQQPSPPPPAQVLSPERAERLSQAMIAYILLAGLCWMWEVEDVDDVPILSAATARMRNVHWPRTEEELWASEPLLQQAAESP